MHVYRPLRVAILIYDLFRLIIMIGVVVLFAYPQEAKEALAFPLLVYIAPNALFPLMALFLLIKPEEYRPYGVLYAAGKVLSAAAGIGWVIFSAADVLSALGSFYDGSRVIRVLEFTVLLIVMDGFSVLGGRLLNKGQAMRPMAQLVRPNQLVQPNQAARIGEGE
ncbi:hypothetical protein FACS1894124_2310 [Spirochaetia bacterium]|nr:hypothetical protein FACS1894124_2310 [Spirochaetia bacterium]